MMLRKILSVFLAAAIIGAGLPVLKGHESAGERGAGLQDVVRVVGDLSRSAENPEDFGSSLRKTLCSHQNERYVSEGPRHA